MREGARPTRPSRHSHRQRGDRIHHDPGRPLFPTSWPHGTRAASTPPRPPRVYSARSAIQSGGLWGRLHCRLHLLRFMHKQQFALPAGEGCVCTCRNASVHSTVGGHLASWSGAMAERGHDHACLSLGDLGTLLYSSVPRFAHPQSPSTHRTDWLPA